MVQNDLTGDGHDQHLQRVGRSQVDEHPHKLQTDHDGQNVMEEGVQVHKIIRLREHLVDLYAHHEDQNDQRENGNGKLQKMQDLVDDSFGFFVCCAVHRVPSLRLLELLYRKNRKKGSSFLRVSYFFLRDLDFLVKKEYNRAEKI